MKATKPLAGAARDAYVAGLLEAAEVPEPAAARVRELMTAEVSQIRIRLAAARRRAAGVASPRTATVQPGAGSAAFPPEAPSGIAAAAFDPYSPNVVVVLRTSGWAAALAALDGIGPENLRLLAREQQLGIGGEAASAAEICDAIVTSAERRVANRRAAAR